MGMPSFTTDISGSPRLRMQGVRKRFGATVALDGVDLQVDRGKFWRWLVKMGRGKAR